MYRLLLILVLSLAIPGLAAADIFRGCEATVEVYANGKEEMIAQISGRGFCSGKVQANKCRERARAELDKCRKTIWKDHRFEEAVPPECSSFSSTRPGARWAREGIRPYPLPHSLFNEVIHVACCQLAPDKGIVEVVVGGTISGQKGCAPKEFGGGTWQEDYLLVEQFNVDCQHWRAQRICG